MTPERKQQIEDAADRAERARAALQAAMAMNVPQDFEKRILAARDYAIKRAEAADSEKALRELIGD
jgi:hypothetical protein